MDNGTPQKDPEQEAVPYHRTMEAKTQYSRFHIRSTT